MIVQDYPPLIDMIDAKFGVRGKPIIYAWGDTIYNPLGLRVPRQLMAHEALHGVRQGDIGIERWWERYCEEDQFRIDEEVLAHRAEYEALLHEHGDNRLNRRRFASHVAERLCSPVYRYRLKRQDAMHRLRTAGS